jgi:plasmid stabilization system protein ParE
MAYEAARYGSRPCRPCVDFGLHRRSLAARSRTRIHTRIRAVTDLLLRYPLAGAVTEDPTIRRVTTTPHPYLIFDEATDAEIIIHAVRHSARDPSGHARSA